MHGLGAVTEPAGQALRCVRISAGDKDATVKRLGQPFTDSAADCAISAHNQDRCLRQNYRYAQYSKPVLFSPLIRLGDHAKVDQVREARFVVEDETGAGAVFLDQ